MSTPSVEMQTLRESQDRALHMEGIPMFLALADERTTGAAPPAVPGATRSGAQEPSQVVTRLDHYRAVLAPHQRDNDLGVLACVLTVAAYEDFDRSVSP